MIRGLLLRTAAVAGALTLASARAQPPPAPQSQRAAPPPAAPAAPADTARADTLHIEAGRARYVREAGEWVSDLEGGVRLLSEGTTIESRRARAYRSRGLAFFYDDVVVRDRGVVMKGDAGSFSRPDNIATLRGRVTIQDEHGTIRAQRVKYWRADRLAWLWGNVDFRDARTRVQADSVLYRQSLGTGEAFGSVVITDLESGSEARGTHAIYDRTTGAARLEPQPLMVLREAGAEDTEVRAAEVRFDREQSVVRALGNVQITRGTTVAHADSALLYRQEDRLLLRGHPRLRRGETTMRGQEIDVFYKDREVDRVAVRGAAHLVQARADTLLVRASNEVQGDSAQMYFAAGELARAVVVGRATSKFVPAETRRDRISRNEARGDSILMTFAGDEVEEVLFKGNASGTYRFYEGDLDSLRAPAAARFDSTFGVVRGDTTAFDFDRRAETVEYSGESILYVAKQNDLLLQRAAEVRYQGRTLRAGRIRFDADTDLLDARDRPALDDAGDRIYGDRMGYDLGTREAWIEHGSTQYDQGYYTGGTLRKKEEGVLQVQDASYTTCDLERPHYRFECGQMKIYLREKIVGRPVVVRLGETPVGYLPFIVNYTDTRRHSGFLQPDIGFGVSGEGRFIRGLQYFWAASPYYDFLFSADYIDRSRPNRSSVNAFLRSPESRAVRFAINTRYALRYRVTGTLNYNMRKTFDPAGDSFFYTLGGSHHQTLGERTTIRGSLDYASSDRAIREVNEFIDFSRAQERNLSSGLTLNRRGEWITTNLTVNRNQLLNPGPEYTGRVITKRLPDLRVSFPLVSLAPRARDPRKERIQDFLHSLQFQPALSFVRETTDERDSVRTVDPITMADSVRFFDRSEEVIQASTGASLGRSMRLSVLSLNPSVSYNESYRKDTRRPDARRSTRGVRTSLGTATTLYGLFYPDRFGVLALRHRIDPRATLSWQPAIANQQPQATSVSLSLANTFDLKVRGAKGERKLDGFLDWRLATNYDPDPPVPLSGPVRKFGIVSSTIQVNRSGTFQLQVQQTYDPYRRRVTSTSVPLRLRFNGRFGYGSVRGPEAQRNRVVEEEGNAVPDSLAREAAVRDSIELAQPRSAAEEILRERSSLAPQSEGTLNWGLSFDYSLRRVEGRTERASVPVSLEIQPTPNWNVGFGTYYDATTRELGQPTLRITRQLHCWKASFSRIRVGDDWQYYFRLFVEQHSNELFVESGERSLGY